VIGYGDVENGDTFTPDPELIPGLLAHPHFKLATSKKAAEQPVNVDASKEV
jgi:hypothetical protein